MKSKLDCAHLLRLHDIYDNLAEIENGTASHYRMYIVTSYLSGEWTAFQWLYVRFLAIICLFLWCQCRRRPAFSFSQSTQERDKVFRKKSSRLFLWSKLTQEAAIALVSRPYMFNPVSADLSRNTSATQGQYNSPWYETGKVSFHFISICTLVRVDRKVVTTITCSLLLDEDEDNDTARIVLGDFGFSVVRLSKEFGRGK